MGFEASGENEEKREVGWLRDLCHRTEPHPEILSNPWVGFAGTKGPGGLVNRRWFL